MKFESKDGKVFDDIIRAKNFWCCSDDSRFCTTCILNKNETCSMFCLNNMRKAAAIMGYKVIEDEPEPAGETSRDISSLTLGWAQDYCEIRKENAGSACVNGCDLQKRGMCYGKDPGKWELWRCALTPEELEICRALGAKWLTKDLKPGDCINVEELLNGPDTT